VYNEELHNLYTSLNVIKVIQQRRIRLSGHVACIGERRNAYRVLLGKPEGKTLEKTNTWMRGWYQKGF
jgi:hypothetical protein